MKKYFNDVTSSLARKMVFDKPDSSGSIKKKQNEQHDNRLSCCKTFKAWDYLIRSTRMHLDCMNSSMDVVV